MTVQSVCTCDPVCTNQLLTLFCAISDAPIHDEGDGKSNNGYSVCLLWQVMPPFRFPALYTLGNSTGVYGAVRRSAQSANKPYRCQYPGCNKSYFHQPNLINHQVSAHGRPRKHKQTAPSSPDLLAPVPSRTLEGAATATFVADCVTDHPEKWKCD